jgi:tRNA A-37 threonylcarbamoyl transferase component Bud32/predicted nucleotidyltransferase
LQNWRGREITVERLTAEEKEDLVALAKTLVKGDVTSVTAYGSKIAGYARADSDYDLIISAPRFNGRVRYKYIDSPVKASALIVRDDLFQGDAKKATLGEFVSGRLLNVHQPLMDENFVRKAEVESKRRVIAELLYETSSQYGEFAQDLIIPLDYFLFEKLHKRALIYPPALYSYIKTYTCESAAENRASTLDGFEAAARRLSDEGFLQLKDGAVRIASEKLHGKAFARLLALFNLTSRGVRQYAVHGYAGRVGLSVVKDEALSKARRMQQKLEPPPEMVHPKNLLRLEEGLVVAKAGDLVQKLAEQSGFEKYEHHTKVLGEVYSTAKVVTITGSESVQYVFKHFADIRSMKWALLTIWAPRMGFSMSPQARMHREYYAGIKLREAGVLTPRVLGVAIDDKVLARDYVEGPLLSSLVEKMLRDDSSGTEQVRAFGQALGIIHRAGFALGDAKAENIIVTGDGPYFTDLEQTVENGDQAWDIAEFLYYASKLSLKVDGIRAMASAFLQGYREKNSGQNVAKAKSSKYLAPFTPFVTLQNQKAIKETLERYAS